MKQPLNLLLIAIVLQLTLACGRSNGDDEKGGGTPPPPIVINDYTYSKPTAGCIRILTYNSFYCKSNTETPAFNTTNTKNFANVIRVLDADIVAIQELDSGVVSRGKRSLLSDIQQASQIDYASIFGNAAPYDGGGIGCGVLIKKTLTVERVEKIALPGNEARILLIVHLPDFIVMATHLDLDHQARKLSAQTIAAYVRGCDKPILLVGDLNDSPAWAENISIFPIINQHFTLMSATDGNMANNIDFILLTTNHLNRFSKKGSRYIKHLSVDGEIKYLSTVSDHYPIFLDIELVK